MDDKQKDSQTESLEETIKRFDADPHTGLSSEEAAQRLEQYGENVLAEQKVSTLRKIFSYFWGPIPWMIEVAAILSGVLERWDDFAIIVTMLVLNAGVGFWQEHKADNAIALLKQKLALKARVLRDGSWHEVAAAKLVPGDMVRLKLGDIVPADARLHEGDYLNIDQSALTGESLPVTMNAGDTAYSGSIIKQGEMTGVVTATGANTYFGKTAGLVEQAGNVSHFQRAVLKIGNFLILTTLVLVALIIMVAMFRHESLTETLLFALILTVAAIPVALPAVLSVTLAVGAEKLARMKAIVSRLVSIEELAGMDVLCSDKTGTLTQNRLSLGDPVLFGQTDREAVILAAALTCEQDNGDAIDTAILNALPDRERLKDYHLEHFQPFDPVGKMSRAKLTKKDKQLEVAKGAPQVILKLTNAPSDVAQKAQQELDALAAKGYRTLGVARCNGDGQWRFLGLLPLFDPPREDSAATIDETRNMGVNVKMVTGDHIAIAKQIAGQLHLGQGIVAAEDAFDGGSERDKALVESADGFAQVFPEHKFEIVKTLQSQSHIVGMTGDGVNDAPALKQADVGIAVSGATDAARAAADLVLTAPGLSVITAAMEEARRIFERMNSYSIYRITETIRVLLFMTLSILVFNFYPVTAVMIVLLALLNDFPIMMIAYDNAKVAPRPLSWNMRTVISIASLLGVLGVVESFLLFYIAEEYMHLPRDTIQTLIFLKLLVAGHLTIYLTRNTGLIWDRPWPSLKLFLTTETTQVFGTLAAVYGWFVEPIGWGYALMVWGYALAWFIVESPIKMLAYRLLRYETRRHRQHLETLEGSLQERR
jgi:H+-transporting ATPase